MNSREIDVYVALPEALYRHEPSDHVLYLISATDVRRVTGYQDFVDKAPLEVIYVADHARMKRVLQRSASRMPRPRPAPWHKMSTGSVHPPGWRA
ncbi:MAG: hypothetical protein ABIR56_12640 [Polaromonas sp.]